MARKGLGVELGELCVPRDTDDLRPWSKARVLGPLPEEWTPGTGQNSQSRARPRDRTLAGGGNPQGFSSVWAGEGEVSALPLHRQHSEKGSMFLTRTPGPRGLKGGLCTQNKSANVWKWEQRPPCTEADTASFHPQKQPGHWPPPEQAAGTALGPWHRLTYPALLGGPPGGPRLCRLALGSVPSPLCPSSAVSRSLPKHSGTPVLGCSSIQSTRGSKPNTPHPCHPFSQDPAPTLLPPRALCLPRPLHPSQSLLEPAEALSPPLQPNPSPAARLG